VQKSRMLRHIPHRRRAVPTTIGNETVDAQSPTRGINLWLGLWHHRSGATWHLKGWLILDIILAVGSNDVCWQSGLWLRTEHQS
jgi:hypothetical protein